MAGEPLLDRTVLVTGGAGFIGSHLVDDLVGTNEVRVLDDLSGGRREWVHDVDLAVEFRPDLSTEDRHRARIDLIVDLMAALDTDAVDVADLSTIQPAVGASALRTGVVLVGNDDRIDQLRERFEAAASTRTHEERLQAFDAILDRLERAV